MTTPPLDPPGVPSNACLGTAVGDQWCASCRAAVAVEAPILALGPDGVRPIGVFRTCEWCRARDAAAQRALPPAAGE
jgi:hypothetical protein